MCEVAVLEESETVTWPFRNSLVEDEVSATRDDAICDGVEEGEALAIGVVAEEDPGLGPLFPFGVEVYRRAKNVVECVCDEAGRSGPYLAARSSVERSLRPEVEDLDCVVECVRSKRAWEAGLDEKGIHDVD